VLHYRIFCDSSQVIVPQDEVNPATEEIRMRLFGVLQGVSVK